MHALAVRPRGRAAPDSGPMLVAAGEPGLRGGEPFVLARREAFETAAPDLVEEGVDLGHVLGG